MPQKFDKKFSPNAQRPARRPGSARPEGERRAPRAEAEEPSSSLVYGKNPVTELLKSGAGVDTVLLADTLPEAVAAYYTALAKEAGAVAKRVHANKLRLTCGTDSHQGVAAFASAVEYASLEQLLDLAKEKGEPPFLVLCDGVEDPHNLGAIIRSALLCGAHGVVIPQARRRGHHPHGAEEQRRRGGPSAGGPGGQHRREHSPPEGSGRFRLLCRHGRCAPASE